jgi:hypothetical protein
LGEIEEEREGEKKKEKEEKTYFDGIESTDDRILLRKLRSTNSPANPEEGE